MNPIYFYGSFSFIAQSQENSIYPSDLTHNNNGCQLNWLAEFRQSHLSPIKHFNKVRFVYNQRGE